MDHQAEIRNSLEELHGLAPAGYAMAFHVKYTTPDFLFQNYSKDWNALYSQNGMVMKDPIVAWTFANNGWIRWSDLAKDDLAGVLEQAKKFDMNYGFACGIERLSSRSVLGFSRSDREFSDAEIEKIISIAETVHDTTARAGTLSPETREALRKLSISFTHP
jgi:LuxR family transcriptional regulator